MVEMRGKQWNSTADKLAGRWTMVVPTSTDAWEAAERVWRVHCQGNGQWWIPARGGWKMERVECLRSSCIGLDSEIRFG